MADASVLAPSINRAVTTAAPSPYLTVPKRLVLTQLTAAAVVLYTAPAAPTVESALGLQSKAKIRFIEVTNTDTVARTFTLYVVESGGGVAANRLIRSAVTIPAGTTYGYTGEWMLEASDTLQGLADVTLKVNVYASGEELLAL